MEGHDGYTSPPRYPLHSPEMDPVPDHQTGKALDDHPPSVHVPKNIQAVQDTNNYHPKGRTIIVCLDGTGDKFDNDNSNIVHLVKCLKKDDKDQVTYYQAGVGTYSKSGLSGGFSAAADMAVGSSLGDHVREAYHFLMHTYKEGDKICLFGFSRGAYTARCLAGMVHKVGLLPPRNTEQIPFAYEFYKNDTFEGWEQSAEFKKTFCIDATVYFLGVFDSVASVGIIPRTLPLAGTPWAKPHYFRHAMALDERRAKFKVCRHQDVDFTDFDKDQTKQQKGLTQVKPRTTSQAATNGSSNGTSNGTNGVKKAKKVDGVSTDVPETEYERLTGHAKPYKTDVKEVWFLGCHADVGGGAVPNDERHKLSNIPLRWMVRQCFLANTGIIFKTRALAEIGLDVHTLWPQYKELDLPEVGPSPSMLERYDQKQIPSIKRRAARLIPVGHEEDRHHHDPDKDKKKKKGDGMFHLKLHDEEDHPSEEAREHAKRNSDWVPEQVEDWFDAMSPWNDQLVVARTWWILEIWPVEYKMQKAESDEWETITGMNLGRYRGVEDKEPLLHWTVKHRMDNMGYKAQARLGRNCFWKVVV